jgi:dihydrofolate reductase
MMEAAWRPPATGVRPDWMEPFARTIDAAKKYVVSSTLDRVDWNAELVRGDLAEAVGRLKRESGKGLFVGGVKLPLALTELGLIDEFEFVVHPRLAGHGPTLFAGLTKYVDLKLVGRREFGSGAVALRYEPRR